MEKKAKVLCIGLLAMILAGMAACDPSSGGPGPVCGNNMGGKKLSFNGLENEYERYLGEVGQTSYVKWSQTFQNVCTARHSEVEVTVNIADEVRADVTVEGSIWYGISHEFGLNFTTTDLGGNIQHYAESEFGIKDVYGDDPGMFIIELQISFPSTGDYQGDVDFVNDNVIYGEYWVRYWEPLPEDEL